MNQNGETRQSQKRREDETIREEDEKYMGKKERKDDKIKKRPENSRFKKR